VLVGVAGPLGDEAQRVDGGEAEELLRGYDFTRKGVGVLVKLVGRLT
jgi:hypothetical protein